MTPDSNSGKTFSPLFPILGIGVSLASVLIWQFSALNSEATRMNETKDQMGDALQKRQEMVKQSVELQGKLQAMVVDLLELAKKDEKAKAIVEKYNIQQTAPAAPAPK